ncbi:MAG: phosphoribosyl transferase [Spirochaetaceae bacterium 4572_7]|nr:MAG: phosphoribosyl transferase [Spirochaetaceae bacterium 4572_7]
MNKDFVKFDIMRNNILKLVHRIHSDGFNPDVIYLSLRGGAYMGNIMSEYYKIVRKDERPVLFAAVVARSYTGVREQSKVLIDGWTYSPEHLRHGDKILFVDDIFDTGRTLNHLVEVILDKGIPREDIKVAVYDYKVFPGKDAYPIQPDYYCNKIEIIEGQDNPWIHYMSHELVGLTKEEFREHYVSTDPSLEELVEIFD